jgi:hypothetical protein
MVMKLVETSTEASSGFRVLEAAHRFVSSLDPAMTLLDLNFRGFAPSSSIIPRVSPCTTLYSRGKGALDMAGYANRTISIDAVSGFIRGQPAPIRTEPMTPATWSDQQPWQEWKASHDPHRPAISGPNPRRTSGLGEWGAGETAPCIQCSSRWWMCAPAFTTWRATRQSGGDGLSG